MKINIRNFESKTFSQNGEDGILSNLANFLEAPTKTFLEIGCSDGNENNSRNLLLTGYSGTAIDLSWKKCLSYLQIAVKEGFQKRLRIKTAKISLDNLSEILRWEGLSPDIFSLDIDSYDFFILDRLFEYGFRPSILCLECNTFLGDEPITVDYSDTFSRYKFQPDYGLYFGASPNAWRHLCKNIGYISLGLDSSGTNIFFILPERLHSKALEFFEPPDVHQSFFIRKYQKSGDELSEILRKSDNLVFLNVTNDEYMSVASKNARDFGKEVTASFVTTFTRPTYESVSYKLIDSFLNYWPDQNELMALSEGFRLDPQSPRIKNLVLEDHAIGLADFKERHRFNPGANGRFGKSYLYTLDAVKWSHKVFAVEVAAETTSSEFVVYIDSDIVTFDRVPPEFLSELLPDGYDIAYMPRVGMYSECSFVIYRVRNPIVRSFILEHCNFYRGDEIFKLSGWTDCHPFDFLIKKYTSRNLLKVIDINRGVPPSSHPFINGPLGQYMDHMKGDRKKLGKSYPEDLVVDRPEEYWRKVDRD